MRGRTEGWVCARCAGDVSSAGGVASVCCEEWRSDREFSLELKERGASAAKARVDVEGFMSSLKR
jgi:hypothetical protein